MNRRAFLGGAGAMIALPLLASLRPRVARGADPVVPRRFVGFYLPCGIVMSNWTPAAEGPAWTSPILTPLDAHRQKVLVLTGVDNKPGRSDGGGDHAAGTGSFLTAVHVKKTAGADISNGISLDQVLAPVLSKGLPLPSLELGTDGGAAVGDCDTGYSCAYARSIAWAGPTSPLPKQTNPAAVFDRLFAGYDPDASAAEVMRRKVYRTSVLDSRRAGSIPSGPRSRGSSSASCARAGSTTSAARPPRRTSGSPPARPPVRSPNASRSAISDTIVRDEPAHRRARARGESAVCR